MIELTLDERTHTAKRDDNGYPLLEDGTIDWELASHEKEKIRARYENEAAVFNRKVGRKMWNMDKNKPNTNLTQPKKKRK